ncbi:carboxymuconolactone decarboxylase family protein [Streptomyces sp. NPDC000151]|uniref:carboxymuconolactone decarboxylase family protein n=1 Tax=Streptomyces sp. NPDC000151 TaxID=3154244 RepID=UPI00331D4663
MTDQHKQIGGGRRTIGDFAPKLAELTDDVLFEDVWNRTELAARDRSLVTVAVLVEAITHLAFYAGWPKAMTAITTAKQVFSG